ncbi:hypothetical protein SO694_00149028 [Aureococcus anophagefferens]|uniref:Uncharacterized protein n=1 Tax=Aureococcus anophagefferens TaxID=44056 RepID=A0ABR1FNM2_AURAN
MPAGGHIPENVAAAACYGNSEFLFDAAAAAAGRRRRRQRAAAAQIVGIADQILPQIYGTAEARDGLALGALADCAGYAAVAGSIKGSQCEVHAPRASRASSASTARPGSRTSPLGHVRQEARLAARCPDLTITSARTSSGGP